MLFIQIDPTTLPVSRQESSTVYQFQEGITDRVCWEIPPQLCYGLLSATYYLDALREGRDAFSRSVLCLTVPWQNYHSLITVITFKIQLSIISIANRIK